MAHYDCSCCGEYLGISHNHCPECQAGRCSRSEKKEPMTDETTNDAVDTATLPQDESLKLTSDLMEAARLTDEAFETAAAALVAVRDKVGNLMASFKAIAGYVGAENAELKFRLEGLSK